MDHVCLSDIQLEGQLIRPSPSPVIVIGVTRLVVLRFRVSNDGEDAFRTTLHVAFPRSVSYINVRDSGTGARVDCQTDVKVGRNSNKT